MKRTMLNTMSSFSFFAHARMLSASSRFLREDRRRDAEVEAVRLLQLLHRARWSCSAFSKPCFTWRTSSCMSPTPSIETRVLKMTLALVAQLDDLGQHRDGAMRRQAGGVDARTCAASAACRASPRTIRPGRCGSSARRRRRSRSRCSSRAGAEHAARSASSVMSSLRSPRVQLLHISQRASQTNVQWKMRTVGWIGRTSAT